jgi:SNF2-related domain
MAPSPQGIIDLTGSDSEYDDKEQERRLADISRFLSSSKKNKRKREGKTCNNDGDDDHSVIVIDSDSDDDDGDRKTAASSSLSAQKKKPKVEPEDKKKPSIKQEGQKLAAAKPTSIAEDGLEVVENVGPRMVAAAAAAASTGDDDVVLEGVANEVRLPHLRQDCTQHPFAPQNLPYWFTTGHTLDLANMEKNEKHCDLCFCYVCDCPVKDCDKWYKHQASRRAENNHCCAMNNNSLWQRLRKEAKKSTTPGVASAPSAAAAASAASNASGSTFQAPPGRHFPRNCPLRRVMQCKDCWCFVCDKEGNDCLKWYSHRHADPAHTHWQGERAMQLSPTFGRSGPFPPDTAGASNDRYLTQCRHCSWFIRREMNNMRHTKKSCDDWCVVCGRVASVKSFAVENDNGLDEEDMKDWYTFGEKTIPFRIHAHDPRLFSHFKSKWEENPNWEYNEAEREEEVFLHLVGKSPSLETLMEKMAYASDDKIPKTGESKEERDQTDAVIVDSPNDINLITILSSRGVREYSFISASWDKQLRSGELKIRFCLPKSAFLNNHGSLNELKLILPAILATWYDLNFDIEELGLRMQPSTKGIVAKLKDCTSTMSVPYGTRSLRMKDHIPSASQFIKSKAEEISTAREARKNDYKLCASDGERGGLSSTDVTFQACLARFFQEHFPTIIQRVSWSSKRTYTTDIIGLCDGQIRGLYSQYHDCLEEKVVDSVCGFTDSSVAKALFSDSASHAVVSDTLSTNTLMAWLENLGHVSEPYVEGINVELLPFQKQALKWAVERERTPGGIQSFYWAKVPATEGRGEDLYFNPLLSQFRKDKPALARGGILAAAMGLGMYRSPFPYVAYANVSTPFPSYLLWNLQGRPSCKLIILIGRFYIAKTLIRVNFLSLRFSSLGLILKNPAPNLPRSGSSIASLNTAPTPTSGEGWDKALYAKTSVHNTKRGSIISRGTLVICPVSLVGQWIEGESVLWLKKCLSVEHVISIWLTFVLLIEAKSRLENPGLVYPYHGQNRKRDANMLAKAEM